MLRTSIASEYLAERQAELGFPHSRSATRGTAGTNASDWQYPAPSRNSHTCHSWKHQLHKLHTLV